MGLVFSKFNVSKNQNEAIICVQFEKPRLLTKWKKISRLKSHIMFYCSLSIILLQSQFSRLEKPTANKTTGKQEVWF